MTATRKVLAGPGALPLLGIIGGDAATVLAVNRGTETVYIGDATVDTDTGMPLPALASICLSTSTTWWVITDAATPQEVDVVPDGLAYSAGAAEIATAVLAAGVVLKDAPVLINIALNVAVPFSQAAIDVTQWQSFVLSIQYEAANVGPPAATGIVTLEWGDTAAMANIIGRQVYEINSVLSTDCGRTIITDRHQGPFMRVVGAAGAGAASTITYVMYGSYRPVDTPRLYELGGTPTHGLGTDLVNLQLGNVIGAGLTVTRNVRIGTGAAMLHLSFSGGGGPYNFSLFAPSIGAGAPFFQRTGLAVGGEFTYQIQLPRRALSMSVTNTGAANGNGFCTLTMERY